MITPHVAAFLRIVPINAPMPFRLARFTPSPGNVDEFRRMLDPTPDTCCGMCSQMILNPDVVRLLVSHDEQVTGGVLNPLLDEPNSITIVIIVRMRITYIDLTDPTNPTLVEVFVVEVLPEHWKRPCSYTVMNCIVFENDGIRMIAPPLPEIDSFGVVSIPDVAEFTADSNVTVIDSSCGLRCADGSDCTPFKANPGDLDFDVGGISFGTLLSSQFIGGFYRICPDGMSVCKDPHLTGLRGQSITWTGVDGGWYSLLRDAVADLHINVRTTAPRPVDFPRNQLITAIAILSGDHSLLIEVKEPYTTDTDGCPRGISPCLSDGAIRITVDGHDYDELLSPTEGMHVTDGIEISSANLPAECQEFNQRVARESLKKSNISASRRLKEATFEEWILSMADMAVPGRCMQFIREHSLHDVQSDQSIFRIVTPAAIVRLSSGVGHMNEVTNGDGRVVVPEMEFWEMGVGVTGIALQHDSLSGLLGETSRVLYDKHNEPVMKGMKAIHGTVEYYRVSDPLATDFALLYKTFDWVVTRELNNAHKERY